MIGGEMVSMQITHLQVLPTYECDARPMGGGGYRYYLFRANESAAFGEKSVVYFEQQMHCQKDRFTTCFKTCGTNSWFFQEI